MAESTLSDESADSDAAAHAPKPRSGCLLGCLLTAPIFYLLSPPFVSIVFYWLIRHGWHRTGQFLGDVCEVVYAPMVWLYDHFQPYQIFMDWYMSLFEGLLTPF